MPIVEQIQRILRPDGSFVMELGGAWNRGGTRSLLATAWGESAESRTS